MLTTPSTRSIPRKFKSMVPVYSRGRLTQRGETSSGFPPVLHFPLRATYWIGCTMTGSPHQAHFVKPMQLSALDRSTSRFVVDSGVPRFTE